MRLESPNIAHELMKSYLTNLTSIYLKILFNLFLTTSNPPYINQYSNKKQGYLPVHKFANISFCDLWTMKKWQCSFRFNSN